MCKEVYKSHCKFAGKSLIIRRIKCKFHILNFRLVIHCFLVAFQHESTLSHQTVIISWAESSIGAIKGGIRNSGRPVVLLKSAREYSSHSIFVSDDFLQKSDWPTPICQYWEIQNIFRIFAKELTDIMVIVLCGENPSAWKPNGWLYLCQTVFVPW